MKLAPAWAARLLLVVLCSCLAPAQTPKLQPGTAAPTAPTVTFTFDWPDMRPPHYSIAVDSAGRAAYTAVDDQGGEPYRVEFTVSRRIHERIFAEAEALGYFRGQFDFTRHRIAFTGSKTLAYADPQRHFETTYNWSENTKLTALTQLFMGIGNALAGGRKLEFLHRFDRLGLNDELKAMEGLAKSHDLYEVHAIESVLQAIADDPAVMEMARKKARHLLDLAATENAAVGAAESDSKTGGGPN